MESASRRPENAGGIFEVRMPSDYGCANGLVLSLLPCLLIVIVGTGKAQSKEDGLHSRGRAGGRGAGRATGKPQEPQYAPRIQGRARMCPPTPHEVGGGTCQRAMGKLYAQCTLRIWISPFLLAVLIE